jgi:DNA-binding XRE family transcriptional regulator
MALLVMHIDSVWPVLNIYGVLSRMRAGKRIPGHRRKLGDAIRTRRKEIGFSQEALAEVVDCHRNFVGRIERGEQNPTVDMLVRFAKALKCTVTDLTRSASL